jgi:excisionase family DNA binding protein
MTDTQRADYVRHVVPSLFASVPRAAKQLGVCELTVRRHVRDGRIRAVLVGGTWRIPRDEQGLAQRLPVECSIQDVANSLEVSEVTVRRWIRSGSIPAKKVGKSWKVPRKFLEGLLAGDEQIADPLDGSAAQGA